MTDCDVDGCEQAAIAIVTPAELPDALEARCPSCLDADETFGNLGELATAPPRTRSSLDEVRRAEFAFALQHVRQERDELGIAVDEAIEQLEEIVGTPRPEPTPSDYRSASNAAFEALSTAVRENHDREIAATDGGRSQ